MTEKRRAHLEAINQKQAEAKAAQIKKLGDYIMNREGGVTVKDICVDLNIPANTVRKYIKVLVESGDVVPIGRDWHTIIYGWHTGEVKPVPKEEVEKIMPVEVGGREFDEVKPAILVDQGDVVWCSSRSGDGQFFPYLILTPWEKKATVIGTFPKGHPCLNMNDNRNVYIGTYDGIERWANLDNVCSRGYAQFGESMGHVSDEVMSDIKSRLQRYYRIPLTDNDAAIADAVAMAKRGVKELKQENARLKKSNEELANRAKQAGLDRDTKVAGMRQIIDDMDADLQGKRDTISNLKAEKEGRDLMINTLEKAKAELETKNKNLGIQLDQMGKDLVDVEAENDKLKKELEEAKANSGDTLKDQMDGYIYHIGVLETRLEERTVYISKLEELLWLAMGGNKNG